ncbi:phosphoglycerate dehydrogenase [Luminiphilus sp. nBUS_07]|uniref:phosphoglycerate dehydrogenase n=1 Tax=Luminiphilus sp. nBUS_07 TaxID=3395314 RepID=UPI003EB6D9A8
MLASVGAFESTFKKLGWEVTAPKVTQTLSEEKLLALLPNHDGWIIGDDPATRAVFQAGRAGRLKAAVKWGIGTDNVDFDACHELEIPISNTPRMFGAEVADIAVGYVIGLARETFFIDREVRKGGWPKPAGISLAGKTVAIVGLGDIGGNVAKRLLAADMHVIGYDPVAPPEAITSEIELAPWPKNLDRADFVVITCALTSSSHHMLDAHTFSKIKQGVRVVNVSRGPVIDEQALIRALESGTVHSAALDVFEQEPLSINSPLRLFESCVFGSHNASNTADAVLRTSELAIEKLAEFFAMVKV